MARFKFEGEIAAFRAELVGNLKINSKSEESKRLLDTWASKGEGLVKNGELSRFDWHKEEVEVYLGAVAREEAIWVLKSSLVEAMCEYRPEEVSYFSEQLRGLGEDPDDLKDFEEYFN